MFLPPLVHERPRLPVPREAGLHVSSSATDAETLDEVLPLHPIHVPEDPPESPGAGEGEEGLLRLPREGDDVFPLCGGLLLQELPVGIRVSGLLAEVPEGLVP